MGYETAKIITDEGVEGIGRFYSTYRGIVVDNYDVNKMNRVKVCVPEILGGTFGWAHPRHQHGSLESGFKYLSPKIGDIVFVTFEYGDPTKPLWEYHGWSEGQSPEPLDGPNKMGFITPEGNLAILDDDTGDLDIYINGEVGWYSNKSFSLVARDELFLRANRGLIILNGEENGGLIQIHKLTEKLNKTIQELENLRILFNSHIHTGVTTGPGTSGPTPTLVTNPFSKYNASDYEDKNCKH